MTTTQHNESRRIRDWRHVLIIALLVTLISHTSASADSFVIRNARVFDGRNVTNDTDVQVEGSKIKAIGKQLKTAADIKIIDGQAPRCCPV